MSERAGAAAVLSRVAAVGPAAVLALGLSPVPALAAIDLPSAPASSQATIVALFGGILLGYALRVIQQRLGEGAARRDQPDTAEHATAEDFIADATDAAMILSGDGRVLAANVNLGALMALETDLVTGSRAADVLPPSLMDGMMIGFDTGLESSGTFECVNAAGERLTVNLHFQPMDWQGEPAIAVRIEDLTEAKRREAELATLAFTDQLTGLQNRLALTRRLTRLGDDLAEGPDASFAICLMDLNRFKPINDTYGHAAGDRLLAEIGARIRGAAPRNATVARMGGDEFVVVAGPRMTRDGAAMLARDIIAAVSQPVDLGAHVVDVGVSIGIALAPLDSRDVDTLLMGADQAMYKAKSRRSGFAFMQDALDEAPLPAVA